MRRSSVGPNAVVLSVAYVPSAEHLAHCETSSPTLTALGQSPFRARERPRPYRLLRPFAHGHAHLGSRSDRRRELLSRARIAVVDEDAKPAAERFPRSIVRCSSETVENDDVHRRTGATERALDAFVSVKLLTIAAIVPAPSDALPHTSGFSCLLLSRNVAAKPPSKTCRA